MTTLKQVNEFFAEQGLNVKIEELSNRNGKRSFTALLEFEGFLWKPVTEKEKQSERMVGQLKYYLNGQTFSTQKAASVYVFKLWVDSMV